MAYLVEKCGEMVVSMDSHKSVPAPFLTKTYQLVDDPLSDHIVSWGDDDNTFVVWRPPEFARDLLPNYFKHNNFSSFVRQLNTYGFRKIVADRWEFANEYFRKGQKHLLAEIHRRKSPQLPPQLHCPPHYHDALPLSYHGHELLGGWIDAPPVPPPPPSTGGDHFLAVLSEDNQRLRRKNSFLVSELTHMKKLYNDIIYFLQNHVSPVPMVRPPGRHAEVGMPSTCGRGAGSCSVRLVEEGEDEEEGVKLFGVALNNGKKRSHPEERGPEQQ